MTSTSFPAALRSARSGVVALLCAACGHNALMPDAGGDASSPPIDALADAAYGKRMIAVEGDVTAVHDPAIVASGSTYYIYSTGQGLPIRLSTDLVHWRLIGAVFATKPAWITTTSASDPNSLWAPDVSYFGGQYHLYYSVSSFGSNRSCIGHASRADLDAGSWTDHGPVLCSNQPGQNDNFNAIDPNVILDEAGTPWLAFGSFWSGIQLAQLDLEGQRSGTQLYPLASRGGGAIEGPFLVRRWEGRLLNIHPSLLPAFRGLDTHERALAAGVKIHGATVHFVTADLDAGAEWASRGATSASGARNRAIVRTSPQTAPIR